MWMFRGSRAWSQWEVVHRFHVLLACRKFWFSSTAPAMDAHFPTARCEAGLPNPAKSQYRIDNNILSLDFALVVALDSTRDSVQHQDRAVQSLDLFGRFGSTLGKWQCQAEACFIALLGREERVFQAEFGALIAPALSHEVNWKFGTVILV